MKTKKKSFVALVATLAIGTASVAGLALGANANHGFVAKADTSITSVSESKISLGTNSITLQAGEEKTLTFDISNVGTYGFTWVEGAATFKFEGIDLLPEDPDEPLPEDPDDPGEPLPDVGDPYEEKNTHGLNEDLTSFYVVVETPNTATVTVVAEEDTEIEFNVAYLVDTGINEFNLVADEPQTFALNNIAAGEYTIELKSGSGTVSFGNVEYVLDAEHTTYNIDLSSPDTTVVTVESDTDVTLKFVMSYDGVAERITAGANSITLKAQENVNAIIVGAPGYYTFTRTGGSATISLESEGEIKSVLLNGINKTATFYIPSPTNTIITFKATSNVEFKFNLAYSATDPNAQQNTLHVGEQNVSASGWGENYTFTATEGGNYSITTASSNAYIMVESEYGAEWVEVPYTFTLSEGDTITFVMATNDFEDDNYTVIITKLA